MNGHSLIPHKFKKRPVDIEAVQLYLAPDGRFSPAMCPLGYSVPLWFITAMQDGTFFVEGGKFYVRTLEGAMHAQHLDWIIKGVKDELYPCKPDIFAMTYVPVESEISV